MGCGSTAVIASPPPTSRAGGESAWVNWCRSTARNTHGSRIGATYARCWPSWMTRPAGRCNCGSSLRNRPLITSARVTVERRQPTETAAAPETGAFEERVVEVRETAEEPVVAKTARVAEEVVVGREATERTETVRDTIRREEVEVSDNTGVKR